MSDIRNYYQVLKQTCEYTFDDDDSFERAPNKE